jgi:AcrR family transcriptional regulator
LCNLVSFSLFAIHYTSSPRNPQRPRVLCAFGAWNQNCTRRAEKFRIRSDFSPTNTNTREEWRTAPDKSALADFRAKPKRRRDRPATEQALIQAATKLFAHRGYEATTTRKIAASAGCSEGLIHRYFNSKAGLLFALIQSRVSQEIEDLNERLPLAPTLEEAFPQFVDWEIDTTSDDQASPDEGSRHRVFLWHQLSRGQRRFHPVLGREFRSQELHQSAPDRLKTGLGKYSVGRLRGHLKPKAASGSLPCELRRLPVLPNLRVAHSQFRP